MSSKLVGLQHLFSIVDHGAGVPLGQVNAGDKDHEIAAFAAVLDRLDLSNTIVTADALHTQRAHAHYLHRHGGKYVFTVKRNQPKLHDRLAGLPWDRVPVGHHCEDKGHGRREARTLQLVEVKQGVGFPHARLAARIVRTRRPLHGTRKPHREVVYAVTNLTWDQVTPGQLAQLVRGHWAIENSVHWVRDVTFDEDRSQVRTGTIPRVMACLRNVAIGLIRTHRGRSNIAAVSRGLGRQYDRVLDLFTRNHATPVTAASTLN